MSENINKSRRSALKSGTAVLLSSGLATRVGAAKSSDDYVGIIYDPQTKAFRGVASGRISERYQNLIGNVNLNGQQFSVNQRKSYHKSDKKQMITLANLRSKNVVTSNGTANPYKCTRLLPMVETFPVSLITVSEHQKEVSSFKRRKRDRRRVRSSLNLLAASRGGKNDDSRCRGA